jgi:hypothetical protein
MQSMGVMHPNLAVLALASKTPRDGASVIFILASGLIYPGEHFIKKIEQLPQ